MRCGIKFCGGCNPRFDRGSALAAIKEQFPGEVEFLHVSEDDAYDALLVIGGCTNCCASHCQYEVEGETVLLWKVAQIPEVVDKLDRLAEMAKNDKTRERPVGIVKNDDISAER